MTPHRRNTENVHIVFRPSATAAAFSRFPLVYIPLNDYLSSLTNFESVGDCNLRGGGSEVDKLFLTAWDFDRLSGCQMPTAEKLKIIIGIEGLNQTKVAMLPRTTTVRQFIDLINHFEKRSDLTHLWFEQSELYKDELIADYWNESALFYLTTTAVLPDPVVLAKLLATKSPIPSGGSSLSLQHQSVTPPSQAIPKPPGCFPIYVINPNGKHFALEVHSDLRIEGFKRMVEKPEGTLPDGVILTYAGKQLQDGNTLQDYMIRMGSTVCIVHEMD
jgi:hypothetical protein